jgi:hypothetical protein
MNEPAEAKALTETLLSTVRLQRHLGARIIISDSEDVDFIDIVGKKGAGIRLATKSSNSAQNRPREMACYNSG